MLQKLSYFNLLFAIAYLLIFLRSGNFNSTAGILMVVVFCWLCLRSYQLENYRWKVIHYLTGLWSLYFAGTLLYGATNVSIVSVETDYISSDTSIYLILSLLFGISVPLHFVLYFLRNYKR